jgi:hypothetical protein
MTLTGLPSFVPHPLLRGGHAQTLAGYWLHSGRGWPAAAIPRKVVLPDGDTIILHDDRPQCWSAGDRAALLLPGLAGCHQSSFIVRIARRLNERGVRTLRMDHRGTGAGMGLARFPYHAGRSDDVLAALEAIADLCPQSPLAVAGFSLSGNMTLKLLGQSADRLPAGLDRAVAVNPPIELLKSTAKIEQRPNHLYGRYLIKLLCRQLREQPLLVSDSPLENPSCHPRTLREFDELFTAPKSGFASAEDYYKRSSSAAHIPQIRIPTLILAARDDPLVPAHPFDALDLPPAVRLHVADSGGHLGYIARSRGGDPDRRWMDWRVVDWITEYRTRDSPGHS